MIVYDPGLRAIFASVLYVRCRGDSRRAIIKKTGEPLAGSVHTPHGEYGGYEDVRYP